MPVLYVFLFARSISARELTYFNNIDLLYHYGNGLPFTIDYDRLPMDASDTDPDRIAYARGLQYILVPENRLGFSDEVPRLARRMALDIQFGGT